MQMSEAFREVVSHYVREAGVSLPYSYYGSAYGIHYAIQSARVDGGIHKAFWEQMDRSQITDIIERMNADDVWLDGAGRWLQAHRDELV